MISDDGNLVLIYNGELYNKYELKKEIEKHILDSEDRLIQKYCLGLYELYGENF